MYVFVFAYKYFGEFGIGEQLVIAYNFFLVLLFCWGCICKIHENYSMYSNHKQKIMQNLNKMRY